MKKEISWKKLNAHTKAVWAGETEPFPQGATQPPTYSSVAFQYKNLEEWIAVSKGLESGHIYGRNTNPTVDILEQKIAALEETEQGIAFSSGMAAISNTLFSILKPGDRIVVGKDTYGGTSKLFLEFLPRFKIDTVFCDTTDLRCFEKEISKKCDLLYLETPTNPTLKIQDIESLSKIAKNHGSIVVVDNTLATPINQNPRKLGADIILHSATKFLCGHSDARGGIVCTDKVLAEKIFHFREINGACLDPHPAYLINRGVKTLGIRIERHNENALNLSKWLLSHEKVDKVFYPGLPDHSEYDIASTQMKGFGGVLSFSINSYEKVGDFLSSLHLAHSAAHLGSIDTIVGPPRTTSHVENTFEERQSLGIPENLIRCSVGIEDINDIKNDFDRALSCI